jgi:Tfx family DNA-binding protein
LFPGSQSFDWQEDCLARELLVKRVILVRERYIVGIRKTDGMAPSDEGESSPEDAEGSMDSFLTGRQLEVLKLREQGRSQQEVAKILGTSRSNVSILEKRAHNNIARAERTLQQWMMIRAPISLRIKAGTDVFALPAMIFQEADRRSIQLPTTSLDIIVQLRRRAPNLFRKRSVSQDVDIYVTEEGELLLQPLSSTISG